MSKKQTMLTTLQEDTGLPSWMVTLREAARSELKEEDVKAIVRDQIDRAKRGDQRAIRFVFYQLMGGNELKGATFIQNNHYGDDETPAKPTKAKPGSKAKVDLMAKRFSSGNGCFNDEDGPEVDLS